MAHRLSRSLATILLASLALPGAHAAELGDARVSSHIGQPLVADIELTAIEHQGTPVQVRLAHPDVYRGANIALPSVLSSLNMSVMQRDGRQFLHVTSIKPVDTDHLHLYLELVDGGQRAVRLSTLWLTADPNPNPAPVPAPAPVPETARPALAWEKAPGAEPMQRVAHVLAPLPETKPASALPHPAPAQPQRVRLPLPALPVHLLVSPKPAPAACTPKPSEDAKACVALDAKNVELRSQIAKLEQKVKVLQVSMQGKPAATAAPARSPAPAAAQPPVAPEVKPAAKPAGPAPILPRKARKQVAPEEQGLPWLAIGSGAAALLALAGGGAWFVRRRRGKGEAPMPPAAVSREGIKSRLMGGP